MNVDVAKAVRRRLGQVKRRIRPPAPRELSDLDKLFSGQSARFDNWLVRREAQFRSDLADEWRRQEAMPGSSARIAAVIHQRDPAAAVDIVRTLGDADMPVDAYVTGGEETVAEVTSQAHGVTRLRAFALADQGRDILPLVTLVNAGLLDAYDLVVKLTSPERTSELAGTAERIQGILEAFVDNPALGLLAGGEGLQLSADWAMDRSIVSELLWRIGMDIHDDHHEFAVDGNYWARAFLLQGLHAFDLSEWDFEEEAQQTSGTTAHAMERLIGILAAETGYEQRELGALATGDDRGMAGPESRPPERARVVARYSPVYSSAESEDGWQPAGLASWLGVAASRPLYRGHEQPNLPADLGFYDLSEPAVQARQSRLARAAGVDAFLCDYDPARPPTQSLEPITRIASEQAMEFCLLWRNESGSHDDGPPLDAKDFITGILPLLRNERYLRIHGQPLLVVSRIDLLSDPPELFSRWKAEAREAGLDGLTVFAIDDAGAAHSASTSASEGADGRILLPSIRGYRGVPQYGGYAEEIQFRGHASDYGALSRDARRRLLRVEDDEFPGVIVGRDTTPVDRTKAEVLVGANPYRFRRWLDAAMSAVATREDAERLVFVDAWNAWQDGTVIEPSRRNGRSYLAAVRDVTNARASGT